MISTNSSQIIISTSRDLFTVLRNNSQAKKGTFDIVLPFNNDPFLGHLSTPITASRFTLAYLSLLPAYKIGLSPFLRGIDIGFAHGYFLFGPFAVLGPLRNVEASSFLGFLSAASIIIILTGALLIYGNVTFEKSNFKQKNSREVDLLSSSGWRNMTSGFILGGFGGCGIAYALIKYLS